MSGSGERFRSHRKRNGNHRYRTLDTTVQEDFFNRLELGQQELGRNPNRLLGDALRLYEQELAAAARAARIGGTVHLVVKFPNGTVDSEQQILVHEKVKTKK